MTLRRATLLAMIGICYTFALRTIGAFLPDVFRVPVAAKAIQVMSLLASLAFVFFYVLFYKDYVQKEEIALKKASVLVIIGSSAMSLLRIGALLLVFGGLSVAIYERFPFLFGLVRSHSLGAIIPWVSSILTLYFFVTFYKEVLHKKLAKLQKATVSAIVGSSIGTLLLTVTLLNFLYSGQAIWCHTSFRTLLFIFLPLPTFGFITVFYFFLTFYKERNVLGAKS